MRTLKLLILPLLAITVTFSGCASWSKAEKGGAIGTAAGGAAGAIIGRASGNTALGAIIGATVGGVTGAVIGKQMDKQAAEIEEEVPGVIVERVGEGIVIEFTNKILFGFDSSDLKAEAKESLDNLIIILNRYPDTDIMITGHTDDVGAEAYNITLSDRRAGAVSDYLIQKSISEARLKTMGYGESDPRYANDTEEGRASNRRVEFVITANEKMIEEARTR